MVGSGPDLPVTALMVSPAAATPTATTVSRTAIVRYAAVCCGDRRRALCREVGRSCTVDALRRRDVRRPRRFVFTRRQAALILKGRSADIETRRQRIVT
jgi:hypothetical protein